MFGRQPAPQHVVGIGHDFHADPVQIGVQLPGGQKERLARLQKNQVEKQRGKDAGIAGVGVGQLAHPAAFRRLFSRPRRMGQGVFQRGVHGIGFQGHQFLEKTPEERVAGGAQTFSQRRKIGAARGGQQGFGLLRRTESAQAPKGRQRPNALRLVVGVPIISVGGVQRNALGLLPIETNSGLVEAGMGLDGKRRGGGQDLEQKGQGVPESLPDRRPENGFGVFGDGLGQRNFPTVMDHGGRGFGVRAHPHLRLGPAVGGDPEEFGNRRGRSPGIRQNRVFQSDDLVHMASSKRSGQPIGFSSY